MNDTFVSLAGHFLIADLELLDPHFVRSVVFLVEHTPEGAFGLVINRPLGLTAAQIVQPSDYEPEFPQRSGKIPLYGGGPVETQAVFCLHTGMPPLYTSAAVREVVPGVWFEPSFPALQKYVAGAGPDLPPDDQPILRLYLGYAGWSADQLEREIQQGAWILMPARSSLVFKTPPQDIWRRAMEMKGGYWSIVAQTGFKPSVN